MARALHRRAVLTGLAASSMVGAAQAALPGLSARIIIIGGGYGGATAARFLRRYTKAAITLIEPNPIFTSCPFSNLVIAGLRDMEAQHFGYDALRQEGITVLHHRAEDVDPVGQKVTLSTGDLLSYDRLIMSPGIDIRWDALDGYDEAAAALMPHAWKAGEQTMLLRKQLSAMEDGGLVVLSSPAAPYRCPPGPYERASLIAHYLKHNKPKSRLLLLDAKDTFSKKPLFMQAWNTLYPDIIEWRGTADDGTVRRVDSKTMRIATDFDDITATVANIIPPQKAGMIADRAGVSDATGWCPVDATTFESALQPNIHVIGDACVAAPMPKSAFAANMQGKICALQIARALQGQAALPTTLANTCYSYVAPDNAFSVAGVYHNDDGTFSEIPGAGGISALSPAVGERAKEATQAADWFKTITGEAFG